MLTFDKCLFSQEPQQEQVEVSTPEASTSPNRPLSQIEWGDMENPSSDQTQTGKIVENGQKNLEVTKLSGSDSEKTETNTTESVLEQIKSHE